MSSIKNMPLVGMAVIIVIACLFILAVVMLFYVYFRYKRTASLVNNDKNRDNAFLRYTVNEFAAAYKTYGQDVNTPGIISSAMGAKMSGLLFCERFLNNAVSLFVTLGLFGTFMGLSLSVSSLTEMISYSNTSEWLSVLDSVGGGLMSALSGMGVAFYTSLVGVACSIVLTILRTVFNPQNQREKLAVQVELWLDHTVAPTLPTRSPKDDATLVRQMIDALHETANSIEKTMKASSEDFRKTMDESRTYLSAFHQTVNRFNDGVHDFSEVDYNLRGTIERMDVSFRDLVGTIRQASRAAERSSQ